MTTDQTLTQMAACWKLGKLYHRWKYGDLTKLAQGELDCLCGLADYTERGVGMHDENDIAFIDEMHKLYVENE